MLSERLMPKIEKNYFPIFICYNFSSSSNFNLTFRVVFCNAIEKSYKKLRKTIHEIPIYVRFPYICAPNPTGRIDSSRLERINLGNATIFFYCYG